ncbi:MAG: L,D-transpeptidase family protein [Magnetococcus sp. MYC-9]
MRNRTGWAGVGVVVLWLSIGPVWSDGGSPHAADAGGVEPVIRVKQEVEERLRSLLARVGLDYPLRDGITMLVFKEEKQLELWAHTENGPRLVHRYPVLAMSGHGGPKRRRGDLQVPEGVYQLLWLNLNSAYHLSLKLDYPNTSDLLWAAEDGRTDLGGDIFIHGGASSVGCVAVGDAAIEELFVLTLMAGDGPAEVIIAPYDFRRQPDRPVTMLDPVWLPTLYREIAARLSRYTLPVALEDSPSASPSPIMSFEEVHP